MRGLLWIIWLVVLPAHGETGSAVLRAIFGPPTEKSGAPPREVFAVRPGVEMTVTYATEDGPVCKLEIPSGVANKQQVIHILEQVVPVSTRGKEWDKVYEMNGISGFRSTYYEHVIVLVDDFTSQAINKNPGATVIFKTQRCGWKPGSDSFDRPPGNTKPNRKR